MRTSTTTSTAMALRTAVSACAGASYRSSTRLNLPRYLTAARRLSDRQNPLFGVASTSTRTRPGFQFSIRSIQGIATESLTAADAEKSKPEPDWKIKMLYDGDCPLCMREVDMLRERNKKYGTIKFVDIGSDDYSPQDNRGLEYETVMGKIHAIMADGTIVTNVEAFRKLYEAVGLGWVYAITKYEPVATIADAVYNVWAKYRLPITGRPPLEQVLEARKKRKEEGCSDESSCKID